MALREPFHYFVLCFFYLDCGANNTGSLHRFPRNLRTEGKGSAVYGVAFALNVLFFSPEQRGKKSSYQVIV